jgi:periodic tryptophan protein 2
MNYTFANLLGAPYRGGSILVHEDTLICPAGNRIREVDLRNATSLTHRHQNPHQVQTVALSPDGGLLLSIDTSGYAFLFLRRTQVLLHRWTLKGECKAASFSQNGAFIAIAVGKLLQVSSGGDYRGNLPDARGQSA